MTQSPQRNEFLILITVTWYYVGLRKIVSHTCWLKGRCRMLCKVWFSPQLLDFIRFLVDDDRAFLAFDCQRHQLLTSND